MINIHVMPVFDLSHPLTQLELLGSGIESGVKALLLKTESYYLQDQQKEMPKADTELFFVIDEKPTSSKDPFALRRAAIGLFRIIIENKLHGLKLH